MKIHRHADAAAFLSSAESWLLRSEPENNLIIGVAQRSSRPGPGVDEYWATVHDGGRLVGAAFRASPFPLAVTRMPSSAIPALLDDVTDVSRHLPGVLGPSNVAELFARQWQERDGGSWHVRFFQRIHVLTEVAAIVAQPQGAFRSMRDSDENLIWEWMAGFVRDTGIAVSVDRIVQPLLNDRRFFMWDDNGPRSIVAAGRDTPHGACITAVYTPFEYRANGYATAAVAALSRRILASGKQFCCLYTDLNNPTSNSIYAKIGYVPVRDDLELVFERGRSYSAV